MASSTASPGARGRALVGVLLLGWTVIAPVVSFYRAAIQNAQRAVGSSHLLAHLSCLTFVFGLNILYMQAELSKIVDRYPGATEGPRCRSTSDLSSTPGTMPRVPDLHHRGPGRRSVRRYALTILVRQAAQHGPLARPGGVERIGIVGARMSRRRLVLPQR